MQARANNDYLVREAIPDLFCACLSKKTADSKSVRMATFLARDMSQGNPADLKVIKKTNPTIKK